MAHFDPAAGNLFREEGAEAIFMHQYVDALTFNSETPFDRKAGGVLWVGKLPDGHTPKEYESRRRCFEAIRRLKGFSWREACRPDLSIRKIVRERDSYQALLNLPSNCPGYTSTFFEHLAMGAVVLQYRTGTPLPEGLEPGKHFLEYDPDRPEELVSLIRKVADNPSVYHEMAQQARRECLARHTLAFRLESLFQKASLCLSAPSAEGSDQVARQLLERAKDKVTRMLEKELLKAK
jgi:glycosyltransferase involved in cell wall biosynthesis